MRRTSPADRFPMRRRAAVCAAGAATLAAAALGGCADLRNAARIEPEGVNVESPAAGVVTAAEARPAPFPSFRDVPARVADIPPPATYASTVGGLTAERTALHDWEAANPEIVSGTQDFAASSRSTTRSGGGADPAPAADQTQHTTDWAKHARDAAKAPAPPSRDTDPPPAPRP